MDLGHSQGFSSREDLNRYSIGRRKAFSASQTLMVWVRWGYMQVQDAEEKSSGWQTEQQSRGTAATGAAQAGAAQLRSDAAELQQSCNLVQAWLAAKKQELLVLDSATDPSDGASRPCIRPSHKYDRTTALHSSSHDLTRQYTHLLQELWVL